MDELTSPATGHPGPGTGVAAPVTRPRRVRRPGVLWYWAALLVLLAGMAWPLLGVRATDMRIASFQRVPLPAGGRDPPAPAEQALVGATESRRQLSARGVPLFLLFSVRVLRAVRQGLHQAFDLDGTRPGPPGRGASGPPRRLGESPRPFRRTPGRPTGDRRRRPRGTR